MIGSLVSLNHALSYIRPDETLRKAIADGRMRTREDVRRELVRMLGDESIRKPRVLRFFRDFFDYDLGGYICKDTAALAKTGVSTRGTPHYRAMFDATASTDRLIELVLQKDRDVLKELLTTRQVVATSADKSYFGKKNNKLERDEALQALKKAEEERLQKEKDSVETLEKEIEDLESNLHDGTDQVPPCFLVNGDFSKVVLEEPDGWEVESGIIDPKELAENRVGGGRKAVVIRQTLPNPFPPKPNWRSASSEATQVPVQSVSWPFGTAVPKTST